MEKDTKCLFGNVFWLNTLTLPTFTSRQHAHPPCCSTGDSTVTNQSVTNQGIKEKKKKDSNFKEDLLTLVFHLTTLKIKEALLSNPP